MSERQASERSAPRDWKMVAEALRMNIPADQIERIGPKLDALLERTQPALDRELSLTEPIFAFRLGDESDTGEFDDEL